MDLMGIKQWAEKRAAQMKEKYGGSDETRKPTPEPTPQPTPEPTPQATPQPKKGAYDALKKQGIGRGGAARDAIIALNENQE